MPNGQLLPALSARLPRRHSSLRLTVAGGLPRADQGAQRQAGHVRCLWLHEGREETTSSSSRNPATVVLIRSGPQIEALPVDQDLALILPTQVLRAGRRGSHILPVRPRLQVITLRLLHINILTDGLQLRDYLD